MNSAFVIRRRWTNSPARRRRAPWRGASNAGRRTRRAPGERRAIVLTNTTRYSHVQATLIRGDQPRRSSDGASCHADEQDPLPIRNRRRRVAGGLFRPGRRGPAHQLVRRDRDGREHRPDRDRVQSGVRRRRRRTPRAEPSPRRPQRRRQGRPAPHPHRRRVALERAHLAVLPDERHEPPHRRRRRHRSQAGPRLARHGPRRLRRRRQDRRPHPRLGRRDLARRAHERQDGDDDGHWQHGPDDQPRLAPRRDRRLRRRRQGRRAAPALGHEPLVPVRDERQEPSREQERTGEGRSPEGRRPAGRRELGGRRRRRPRRRRQGRPADAPRDERHVAVLPHERAHRRERERLGGGPSFPDRRGSSRALRTSTATARTASSCATPPAPGAGTSPRSSPLPPTSRPTSRRRPRPGSSPASATSPATARTTWCCATCPRPRPTRAGGWCGR